MGLFGRLPAEPVYNTQAVVQRTGVPADTFRAWERRYGLPVPARTGCNQRLYSDRDVATIAWLRDQTKSGMTISQAIELFRRRDAAARVANNAGGSIEVIIDTDGAPEVQMTSFVAETVEALIRYDDETATRVVEEALALLPVEDVCLNVLQPVLVEIGRRWTRGEVPISAEHFATAFVLRRVGALFNLSRPEIGRGPVVAACLEGEMHEVGLLLTCLFLSRRGFKIVYLGPNLPTEDLIATVQRTQPPLVLLSASTPPSAERLRIASAEIVARCTGEDGAPYAPKIGFGGGVFCSKPELQIGIDGTFMGQTPDEVIASVEAMLEAQALAPAAG